MSPMTADDRDSLRRAMENCRNWRFADGVYVGDHNGWIFQIGEVNGDFDGNATHTALHIETSLSPHVARAWVEELRTRAVL